MRINNNVMSYVAYNATMKSTRSLAKASEKLATGLRVNSAADDAAGLAISEKMTAQIRGLDQACRNAQDGMSLLQTAEGALNEIHSILQRMRELSIQAASDVLTAEDRSYIQLEVNELSRQITDIANQTQFNKKQLLNGDSAVLWSTSTSDIRVLVGGTLLKKDIFGQTVNAEGNYKITFETVQAGNEQVQKSNILYLKHGTLDTNGTTDDSSGVNSFSALNMVEGVWRVETRAEPFGGVYYYQGNYISSSAVGATLDKNGVSDLAPGEYAIQLSDNVPMMVDMTDALRKGTVTDVNISSRGLSSNFDAVFSVNADITAGVSASIVYRNDIAILNNNYATGTIIADGVTASSFDPTGAYYVGMDTNDANNLNVFTRYEVTGTDRRDLLTGTIDIQSKYVAPSGGKVDVTLDYQTEAGSKVKATLDYVALDDSIVFEVTDSAGNTQPSITISGLSGKNLDEIAGLIQAGLGSSNIKVEAEVTSPGVKHLVFTQIANAYTIKIAGADSSGPTSIERELGLYGASAGTDFVLNFNDASPKAGVVDVYVNYEVSSIAVGGESLYGLGNALAGTVSSLSANTPQNAGGLDGISLVNTNSMYKVTFADVAGSTMAEINGGAYTVGRSNGSAATTADTQHNVYNSRTVIVDVSGKNYAGITSAINSAVITALGSDNPTSNDSLNLFSLSSDQIALNNASTSGYKVTIGGNVGDALWVSGNRETNRNDSIASKQDAPDSIFSSPINIAGMTIEQARTAINSVISASGVTGLYVGWVGAAPDSNGQNTGQLRFYNNTVESIEITQTGTDSGDSPNASRSLFAGTGTTVASGSTADSQELQARDKITLDVNWVGNGADGSYVSGSDSGITIWEGDLSSSNAAALNAGTSLFGGNFYEFFSTKDNETPANGYSDFKTGDSWIVYTSAAAQSNSDSVTVNLMDGKYLSAGNNGGVSNGIKYVFDGGALDGNSGITINQMIRSSNSGFETLSHNIEFGPTIVDTSFAYGERSNGGDYTEWAMGGSRDAMPYYAQAYYGEQTTYHIASGASIGSVVQSVQVNKMNDVNGSLLFIYHAGSNTFEVKTETVSRNGGPISAGNVTIAASLLNGAPISIKGIAFDGILVDSSGLTDGDKFVINVAAAAKLDSAGSLISNENISIYADLARSGGAGWDSASQYRFANGATPPNGNYKGFIIDNLTGAEKSGALTLNVGTLNPLSGVGNPGKPQTSGDDEAFWIRAEVNNQGSLIPGAGGLVTSVYIKDLEKDATKDVINYIPEIKYAEVKGDYGKSTADGGPHNDYNASVIFDFLGFVDDDDDPSTADKARFRIQAHVMDINGNYAYIEDEEKDLVIGQNAITASGTQFVIFSATQGADDYCWQDTLPGFTGLYFDSFNLSGTWEAGDRFTLSLMASGAAGGSTKDSDGIDQSMDEVTFFSDLRGTALPHSFRFNNGAINGETTDFHIYQLANNTYIDEDSVHFASDQVMDATVSLGVGTLATAPDAVTFTSAFMRGIDAGVAHYYSRPEDIKQFWNANGVFLLEDQPETLTVKLGDRETVVYIDRNVEIGKLARRMSEQIWLNLIEGQGEITKDSIDDGDPGKDDKDKDEIVQFVNSVPGESPNEAVFGTLVAHSVIPGANYKLEFSGSEELMKALAFREIVAARDTIFEMTVYDAHSDRLVQGPRNVIAGQDINDVAAPGISLAADAAIGTNEVHYKDASGMFGTNLSAGATFDRYIHLADNALVLQIGANQGEDTVLVLGDMTAKALGVHNLEVRQRQNAARSVTRIDNAIRKVSTQRAIIGAQANRLEHAVNAITVASTNLSDSRSKIKDVDYASEMLGFTKLNILQQAGFSMQTQANQAISSVLTLLR